MVDSDDFTAILTRALGAGEYADAFHERRVGRSYRLQDGRIHEGSVSVTSGIGIRVLSGERQGYAFSDDLSRESLLQTARVAGLIARDGTARAREVRVGDRPAEAARLYGEFALPIPSSRYVDLLSRADVAARGFDPRIVSVVAQVSEELQEVTIATSDGVFVRDRRPLCTLGVQSVAAGATRGNGYAGDGSRGSVAYFEARTPESIAVESARIATVASDAREAPAGEMDVVVGNGGGGVLLHEAVGHGLEGDFNRQNTSLYSGRIGERVASELVTIYDDGNLPCERGTVAVDDEGTPGQHKVLVENGVLRGYMHDRLNAGLMGSQSTGSGRRQSFRSLPQPRMCNTYMPSGTSSPGEIVASVKRGIYCASFSGGQVEISKGDFVFMIAEGYLIENGRLTTPIRGASLTGNGPDIMTRVVMVGHDSRFASRHYTCGKGGQYVPVGVGMPTVKIEGVTVGGSRVA